MATKADQAGSAVEPALVPGVSPDGAETRRDGSVRQRLLEWHQKHAVWLWPVLATAAICLWRATTVSLWWDELTSYEIATRSVSRIWHTVHHVDAVHATYYILLHFWISAFGKSILVIRLPGILAMIGAAACTALTAQRLFGKTIGLTSGLVFALLPVVARYSTELRSYPLVVFFAALSTLLLVRALEKPSSWTRWLGYAVALAATGYFNLVALSIVSGQVLGVLVYARDARWKTLGRFAVAAVAGAASALPIALTGHKQLQAQVAAIGGSSPGPTLTQLYHALPQIICSTAAAVALVVALVLAWRNPERRAVAFAAALAVVPILAVWVVSHHGITYFYFSRYFAFTAPAWAMVAGATARWLPGAKGAVAVVAAFAVVAAPAQREVHSTYSHFWYNYPGDSVPPSGYQLAAHDVAPRYQPGDAATFAGRMDYFDAINYYLPSGMRLEDILVARTAAASNDMFPVYCRDTESCVAKGPQRVWLFVPGNASDPFGPLPPAETAALKAHYAVSAVDHVKGITIALLIRTG